ncbi:uncharacterized protein FTOL_11908 [Fusarium torulosum]|uniref:Uncharacterized protein n=1 Tax=Fusarium torulosum TaxID=33205 RepID=A0AAE8SNE9_9HYPO|nr:uncharacterized protein FTOL_11908 [Fusarium torulosum]
MSLMCKEEKANSTGEKDTSSCPFCRTPSNAETGVEVECRKCKRFFTRVVEVDDDDPLPYAPTALRDGSAIRFGEPSFSTGLKRQRGLDDVSIKEGETCHTCHHSKRRKGQTRTKRKRDLSDTDSDSDDGDVQGLVRVHLISKRIRTSESQVPFQANQTLPFDQLTQKVLGKVVPRVSHTNATTPEGLSKDATLQEQANSAVFGTSNVGSCNMNDVHQEIRGIMSSMTSQSGLKADRGLAKTGFESTSHESVSQSPSQILRSWDFGTTRTTKIETSADKSTIIKKHRVPNGYSLKHWDPNEEPILLLGSVFDANSIGKWIYDWAVFIYGPGTPASDMAGELWLLLIQLADKVKRSEETIGSIRCAERRELVEDFLKSGKRMAGKFQSLLQRCESLAVKAWKARTEKELKPRFDKKGAIEIVEAMFGVDQEFGRTEKFMMNASLYILRFDANCEEILRNPAVQSR